MSRNMCICYHKLCNAKTGVCPTFDIPGEKIYNNVKQRIEMVGVCLLVQRASGGPVTNRIICLRDNSVLNLTPNTAVKSEMIFEFLICFKSKYIWVRMFFLSPLVLM